MGVRPGGHPYPSPDGVFQARCKGQERHVHGDVHRDQHAVERIPPGASEAGQGAARAARRVFRITQKDDAHGMESPAQPARALGVR